MFHPQQCWFSQYPLRWVLFQCPFLDESQQLASLPLDTEPVNGRLIRHRFIWLQSPSILQPLHMRLGQEKKANLTIGWNLCFVELCTSSVKMTASKKTKPPRLPCTYQFASHILYKVLFDPHNNLGKRVGQVFKTQVRSLKPEIQKGYITCPTSNSWWVKIWDSSPGLPTTSYLWLEIRKSQAGELYYVWISNRAIEVPGFTWSPLSVSRAELK